jgi:type I restriction enzyme, S subunit
VSDLPAGWERAPLADLAAADGITDGPFGSNLKTEHYTHDGPRVVRLQNIGDGAFRDERAHISEAHFERLAKHSVLAQDVLVASLGELLPRACVAPPTLGPAIVKADCIRVRAGCAVHPSMLMWLLNAPQTREHIGAAIKGVGRPRINLRDLRALELPVPPLAEQKRIIAAIEEAFSKLDAGEAGLRNVGQLLKRMRDSVLTAAVTGRLVPQDPTDTPAAKLVADLGIAATETGLFDIPETWVWADLGVLLREPLRNGMSAPAADPAVGLPTFSISAVTTGDFSDTNIKYTSGDWDRARDLWAEPGDVFVQRSNTPELVGTARLFQGKPELAIFPDLLIRVRLIPQIRSTWLEMFMSSRACRRHIRSQAKGLAGSMPKISQPVLLKLGIPVPPENEQARIVAGVERQMSFIDACERAVDAGLERSAALRRSVLKAAFEGRLVPQDPTDEPAAMLLQRIRAERAAAPKPRRRRARSAP